jgi:hypothetical protein
VKKNKKFIAFLIFSFALLVLIKLSTPEPLDWKYSFSKEDKIPLGSFILFEILPDIFPKKNIQTAEFPIYNILKDKQYSEKKSNYIFINQSFFPDELDTQHLLEFVEEGNSVFAAAMNLTGPLADSLGINIAYSFNDAAYLKINFTNENLKREDDYWFDESMGYYSFTLFDTANTVVLGADANFNTNYIKINRGNGNFYLSSLPAVFTNYALINEEENDYIFKALSHLSNNDIIWDEYYKIGKSRASTPLRFILSDVSLKWAYIVLICSVILYIIFFGRRRQRIIPLVVPLKNTTLQFVETVGGLYYQQGDHKNISEKKITYFLDFIRSKYFVKTNKIDEETIEKITLKSGLPKILIKKIFGYIFYIKSLEKVSEAELNKLNSLIENFLTETKNDGRTK